MAHYLAADLRRLTRRPDVCDHHSLNSSMSASRSAQLLDGDRAFAVAGALLCNSYLPPAIFVSDSHGSVVISKHINLESHITLFCFSF